MDIGTALAWVAIILAGLAILFEVAFFIIQVLFARNVMQGIMKENADMAVKVTESISKVEGIQEYLQNIHEPMLNALISTRGPDVMDAVEERLAESVNPALDDLRRHLASVESSAATGEKHAIKAHGLPEMLERLTDRVEQIPEEAARTALSSLSARREEGSEHIWGASDYETYFLVQAALESHIPQGSLDLAHRTRQPEHRVRRALQRLVAESKVEGTDDGKWILAVELPPSEDVNNGEGD